MIGRLSTLAPNFCVPCGRPAVAISFGATGAPCARARVETPAIIAEGAAAIVAAAAALLRNVRRVKFLSFDISSSRRSVILARDDLSRHSLCWPYRVVAGYARRSPAGPARAG